MKVAPKAVTETSRDHHTRLALIRSLLCEYRVTGDVELAEFVENYTRALELDLADATAAGKVTALQHISEDVSALLADTQLRVSHERSRRNAPGIP